MSIDLGDSKNFKLKRFIQDGAVQQILRYMYEVLEEARDLAASNELVDAYLLNSMLDDDSPRFSGILELKLLLEKLAYEGDFLACAGKAYFKAKLEEVDPEKPLPRATRKALQPISAALDDVVSTLNSYKYHARTRIAEDAMLELYSLSDGPRPGGLVEFLIDKGQSTETDAVEEL